MTVMEYRWAKALDDFLFAYTVAAESAMSVPDEIYQIATHAARYMVKYKDKFPPTTVTKALAGIP